MVFSRVVFVLERGHVAVLVKLAKEVTGALWELLQQIVQRKKAVVVKKPSASSGPYEIIFNILSLMSRDEFKVLKTNAPRRTSLEEQPVFHLFK